MREITFSSSLNYGNWDLKIPNLSPAQNFGEIGSIWTYKAVEEFQPQNPDKIIILESIGVEEIGGQMCNVIQRTNGSCETAIDKINYVFSNIENLNLERIELNLLEKGIFVAIIELDNKSRFLRKLIVI